MKLPTVLFLFALSLFTLSGCSLFGIRTVEEAPYTVVEKRGDFEVRRYASYYVAEVAGDGNFDDATGKAFGKLFRYISGDNVASERISMTAPVEVAKGEPDSEKISMTAPVVLQEKKEDGVGEWTMAFVLPAKYGEKKPPVPKDSSIEIRRVEPSLVAVLRYTWFLDESSIDARTEELLRYLDGSQYEPAGEAVAAGFDPPWTLPFLKRNEIQIPVSEQGPE